MLGTRIKEIRKNNELTQKEFGDVLLHTKSTVSKWENNIASPDISTLKKISNKFNVDLNVLLNDDKQLERTPKKKTNVIFEWDKVSYTGFKNLEFNKAFIYSYRFLWISLIIAGAALFIPMFIARDSYGRTELKYLLIGLSLIMLSMLLFSIGRFLLFKDRDYKARINSKISIFNINIELENKSNNKKIKIPYKDINVIKFVDPFKKNIGILELKLNNNNQIRLFDVDSSVYKEILKLKNGKGE